MEIYSLESLKQAFNSKMNAGHFFYEEIKKIYQPGKLKPGSVPNQLYYYIDGVIFELHAASQILLQIINAKSGLNEEVHRVKWNSSFESKLRKKSPKLCDWWNDIFSSADYHILEAMRHHIAHRGGSFVQASVGENDIIDLLSIPVRWRYRDGKPYQVPSGRSIELLDELEMIGQYLSARYRELEEFAAGEEA